MFLLLMYNRYKYVYNLCDIPNLTQTRFFLPSNKRKAYQRRVVLKGEISLQKFFVQLEYILLKIKGYWKKNVFSLLSTLSPR
jgi:hypothetical protein